MTAVDDRRVFRSLWVMMIGFLLVVVDSTAVAVATPVIRDAFGVDYHFVIWVSSAYMLAFAAFLLPGGRLGDRFGPRNLYLLGLTVFGASSVACGLAGSVDALIAARVVQGVGAAVMTPQILTTITRAFPPERRGAAMAVWGATAGVGMFAGPVAGGVLVDGVGWRWIFLVNAPLATIGVVLAAALVPAIPGRRHHLDLPGVVLSGTGIGLVVYGLQEGQHHGWPPSIWAAIAGGLVLIAAFVGWQAVQRDEPLIPLTLFRHRDFVLANAGIVAVSFAFVAFAVPLMFYLQEVCTLPATRAALLIAPIAIATAALAPVVGRMVDRLPARPIIAGGFALLATALFWLSVDMTQSTPVWRLLIPLTLMGAAGALTWEPLAVIASRTLPPELAGAGSAMCNTSRQVGAALSSAGIAALMTALIGGEPVADGATAHGSASRTSFAVAMSESMMLPAAAAISGVAVALLMRRGSRSGPTFPRVQKARVAP